jgi:Zn-dependent membrane protease YugP
MSSLVFYGVAALVYLFAFGVQRRLKSTYARWSQVRNLTSTPGGQIARIILDRNHLQSVRVDAVPGTLTDHYDPRRKQLRLARDNYATASVAAMAVAAHECGHAIQDAEDYRPMELKMALVPLANAASRFGLPVAILGSFIGSTLLVQIGILGYAGAILLTFLALPVEFNASRRALAQLEGLGLVSEDGHQGAREVLRAAAMTYVAGVASSTGYLLYLLIVLGRSVVRRPTR